MNVAFIPARGGSKAIPLKNIRLLYGKPLIYWTSKAACESKYIDKVYVATDSEEIKECVQNIKSSGGDKFSKLEVIGRSKDNASDTASTESAMLEFANNYEFDVIVLIQATSPLIEGEDIDNSFEIYNSDDTDSVLSVVHQKRFLWEKIGDVIVPQNYDVYARPRRQDFEGFYLENGALYITSREALMKSRNRVSGKIKAYVMPEDTAIEIDEYSDFYIVEALLEKRMKQKRMMRSKKTIKMIVMDCDGCLTDGGMYYSENGDELKKFNTKDGMAISRIRDKGIITGIITGEVRMLNRRRADKLRINFIKEGVMDKARELKKVCEEYNISCDEVLYIGDDVNDIEAMKLAGLAACPLDADERVKANADFISNQKGGYGAVREIIDGYWPNLRES